MQSEPQPAAGAGVVTEAAPEPETALPPEPPNEAPLFVVAPQTSKRRANRRGLMIASASLIALGLAGWTIYEISSVSSSLDAVAKTQGALASAFGQQIKAVSEDSSKRSGAAAKIAVDARATADAAQRSTKDVEARVSGLSGRLESARREISNLDQRLSTLEKNARGPLPRMELSAPPKAAPPAPAAKVTTRKPLVLDPHHHDADPDAHPPAGTVVIDGHWLAINPETHRQTELIPYAHNASGTMVHSVPDGKHYLINAAGEWIGQVQE